MAGIGTTKASKIQVIALGSLDLNAGDHRKEIAEVLASGFNIDDEVVKISHHIDEIADRVGKDRDVLTGELSGFFEKQANNYLNLFRQVATGIIEIEKFQPVLRLGYNPPLTPDTGVDQIKATLAKTIRGACSSFDTDLILPGQESRDLLARITNPKHLEIYSIGMLMQSAAECLTMIPKEISDRYEVYSPREKIGQCFQAEMLALSKKLWPADSSVQLEDHPIRFLMLDTSGTDIITAYDKSPMVVGLSRTLFTPEDEDFSSDQAGIAIMAVAHSLAEIQRRIDPQFIARDDDKNLAVNLAAIRNVMAAGVSPIAGLEFFIEHGRVADQEPDCIVAKKEHLQRELDKINAELGFSPSTEPVEMIRPLITIASMIDED